MTAKPNLMAECPMVVRLPDLPPDHELWAWIWDSEFWTLRTRKADIEFVGQAPTGQAALAAVHPIAWRYGDPAPLWLRLLDRLICWGMRRYGE